MTFRAKPPAAAHAASPAVVPSPVAPAALARFTPARVGIGRAGPALPTRAHLAFVGDHARARDAVWTAVDFEALARGLAALGLESLRLRSQAEDRATYLRRPDLGRRLAAESAARVAQRAISSPSPVGLVIADGLSAEAVQQVAVPVVAALLPRLVAAGVRVASAMLVEQGRVAVGDPIGEALGADLAVVLIGERPGLSAADSLGCYVTWSPKTGTPDSRRNCVSNIRPGGLSPEDAAAKIAWIVAEAHRRRLTGVELKENATELASP